MGFPNRYGGNRDFVNKKVIKHIVGRYVSDIEESDPIGLYKGKIDTTSLVDFSKSDEEYSIDGMSGGGVFTTLPQHPNYLIGMIYAGTVNSQIVRFIHASYIQKVIEAHLEDEKHIQLNALPVPS